MKNDFFTKLVSFISSKNYWYWVWRVLGVVIAFFVVYLVTNFTLVHISILRHDNITEHITIYSSSQNQNDEKVFMLGDFGIVRRNTVSLRAVASTYQTTKPLSSLPFFNIPSVAINLYKDHDVEKYSGDSLGCVSYDKKIDKMLSYSCGKPDNLVYYNRPSNTNDTWKNELVTTMIDTFPPVASFKPFAGGLLGIQQHPDTDKEVRDLIVAINSSGKKTAYALPLEVSREDIPYLNLVVDTSSNYSKKFLVVNSKTGDLFLGNLESGSLTYVNSKFPANYSPQFDALICALLNDTAYCYSGSGDGDNDNELHESYQKNTHKSTLSSIDFGHDTPSNKTYTLEDKTNFSRLYITQSKKLYLISSNELGSDDVYSIQVDGSSAMTRPILTNVSSSSFGDGITYIQDNAIYKLDDKNSESYLVFKSKNLRLSNVLPIGDDIFFNTFIADMTDGKIHTYKLLNTTSSAPNGKRLVDLLPFYFGASMINIDYMDTVVRVRVFATATPDKQHDKLTYDENEFNINKQGISDYLTSRGITPDKYQIIYTK